MKFPWTKTVVIVDTIKEDVTEPMYHFSTVDIRKIIVENRTVIWGEFNGVGSVGVGGHLFEAIDKLIINANNPFLKEFFTNKIDE